MLFLLFLLILVSAALGTSYYFTNKMSAQRKQILLLKYQNNNLKQISKDNKDKNITIEYISPNYNEGIITKKCKLLMSPMFDSPTLNFLNESTLVKIQDSAKINNELWYEVSLTSNERVKTKGWIKDCYIIFRNDISN